MLIKRQLFVYFSVKTYIVTIYKNRLGKTVLQIAHKIAFNGKIRRGT